MFKSIIEREFLIVKLSLKVDEIVNGSKIDFPSTENMRKKESVEHVFCLLK